MHTSVPEPRLCLNDQSGNACVGQVHISDTQLHSVFLSEKLRKRIYSNSNRKFIFMSTLKSKVIDVTAIPFSRENYVLCSLLFASSTDAMFALRQN